MQAIFGVEQAGFPSTKAQIEHWSLNSIQSGLLLMKSAMLCTARTGSSATEASDKTGKSIAATTTQRLERIENGMIPSPISVSLRTRRFAIRLSLISSPKDRAA
jgi:hypothetical protein